MTPAAEARHHAIYVGRVQHRRFDRVGHGFGVRVGYVYLDLDELDAAFVGRWFWSARRFAPMRFRRADYFGDPTRPLADEVRDAVARALGSRPDGPVRILTTLRCWGVVFNPVSFYYCFDQNERLVAVLAQVTNTPWRERHHYVLGGDGRGGTLHGEFAKEFHVSPFQPMAQHYHWVFEPPGERLVVHMANHEGGRLVFDAAFVLQRRPWTTGNLLRAWCRHPWMAMRIVGMIYLHAFLLWCKRATFHTHPKQQRAERCPGRS